jgi:hypothetical protein
MTSPQKNLDSSKPLINDKYAITLTSAKCYIRKYASPLGGGEGGGSANAFGGKLPKDEKTKKNLKEKSKIRGS